MNTDEELKQHQVDKNIHLVKNCRYFDGDISEVPIPTFDYNINWWKTIECEAVVCGDKPDKGLSQSMIKYIKDRIWFDSNKIQWNDCIERAKELYEKGLFSALYLQDKSADISLAYNVDNAVNTKSLKKTIIIYGFEYANPDFLIWIKNNINDLPLTEWQHQIVKKGSFPNMDFKFFTYYYNNWFYIMRSGRWIEKYSYVKGEDGLYHIGEHFNTYSNQEKSLVRRIIEGEEFEEKIWDDNMKPIK